MKSVAIVSGKGGTGKTSFTAALSVVAARKLKIVVADCDVDTPNLTRMLLSENSEVKEEKTFSSEKAEIDKRLCKKCYACIKSCNFGALKIGKDGFPEVQKIYCEGCGVCTLVCKEGAIRIIRINNGKIVYGKSRYGFCFVGGKLEIGESGSGKIVAKVKKKACEIAKNENAELLLIDSSPGIGCPVIASLSGVERAIIVTEPSISALSDMKKVLKVIEHFGTKPYAVVNKASINPEIKKKILEVCSKRKIEVIAEFPFDEVFVKSVNSLTPLPLLTQKYDKVFEKMLCFLLE